MITCMSPVEAFATGIKIFDWQNVRLIGPSKALDRLIFMGQRSNCSHVFFDFHSSEVILIPWLAVKKGFDHLILVANTYTQDIKVTTLDGEYSLCRKTQGTSSLIPSLSPQKQGESLGMKLRDIIIH